MYPMRAVSADRGSPPSQCPAGRRDGFTALMFSAYNDRHEIVDKLVAARADPNTKHRNGCALPPSARPAASLVADCADCACAVRQGDSAALCGVQRLHQIRRGAARRRRRPDRHGQQRVTLCRPQRRRRGRTPNRPESAQANASSTRTSSKQARRVRRGGGGGAAAGIGRALLLRPASHAMPRHARSTAQTALFGLHRHTRGVMCASHCARSAGVAGRQRVRREHSTLQLTLRGTAPPAANTGK